MARWEPGSRGRLREAAFALYAERGFENTTVAEIAARAGLTERTFFRQFADKREVLFAGSEELQARLVSTVADAPGTLGPVEAAAAGVEALGALLPGRERARQRQALIEANPELQERELIKFASLSEALAATLQERALDAHAAGLTAELGMAIFKVAYERWIDDANDRDFPELVRESLGELRALATSSA